MGHVAFRTVEDVGGPGYPSYGCQGVGVLVIRCPAYRMYRGIGSQRESLWKGGLEVLEDARDHTIRPCRPCVPDQGAFGIVNPILLREY